MTSASWILPFSTPCSRVAFLASSSFFSVGGHPHFSDDDVARVDTNVHGLSVCLFATDSLNVDDVFFTVNGDDLAGLFALEVTPHDFHFIVLHQRHTPSVVLSAELFAQTGTHDLSSEVTGRVEMRFSALSS